MAEPRVSASQRQAVADRAAGCCKYCLSQERFSPDPFSVEHIVPRSAGGIEDEENLAFSCQGCNNRKYTSTTAIDPVTGLVVALFNPRRDSWTENFVWNNDFTQIVALTPTGRATVAKLQLNRPGVANLRSVLREIREHPPAVRR